VESPVAVESAPVPVLSAGAGVAASGAGWLIVVSPPAGFSLEPESLQATKAPIAKTNNSFFIVPFFVLLTNDLMVNTESGKK
jgi:hypothetical protein